jgi:hypothetical protein
VQVAPVVVTPVLSPSPKLTTNFVPAPLFVQRKVVSRPFLNEKACGAFE